MKILAWLLLISCLEALASPGSRFIPERGSYDTDFSTVVNELTRELTYLKLEKRLTVEPHYKLTERNEYQLQNWYFYDWYNLQEKFSLDTEVFSRSYQAKTFTEAKRLQYKNFAFNPRTNLHRKTIPTMKEWGGLTHPPLRQLSLPLEKYHEQYGEMDYSQISSAYFEPAVQNKIDQLSLSELSFGNEVHALADHQSFLKKKEILQKAKHSILISTLALVCDESTKEIMQILLEKKQQGLTIKVLVDGMMNRVLTNFSCPKTLRAAGIEVLAVGEFFKYRGKTLNHSKVVIVDLEEAVAGGQNFLNADHYSRGTDFQNRDVDLYAQGPLVRDMARAFLQNWEHHFEIKQRKNDKYPMSSGKDLMLEVQQRINQERAIKLRGQENYQERLSDKSLRMQGVCRFVNQTPYQNPRNIGATYLELLNHVSDYLMITDPIKTDSKVRSFADKSLIDKLDSFQMFNQLHDKVLERVSKGVKLDYLTTNIDMAGNEFVAMTNDKIRAHLKRGNLRAANINYKKIQFMNRFYGKAHYKNLLKDYVPLKNVQVWTHISFLHSKIFIFDRVVASVGSYNFQHNATDHAYESTTICMDQTLNKEIDHILVLDMANSIPLIFSQLE